MTRQPHHRQSGLTLTETITALAVLGIGVLCIATVYLERTQAAPAVLLHSKADRLAEEMAARMKLHPLGEVLFENPVGVLCKTDLQQAKPQELATNDVACWQEKIAATLPNGSGAITMDSESIPKAYLITVSWSPPRGSTASYLLRVNMPETERPTPAVKAAARAAN